MTTSSDFSVYDDAISQLSRISSITADCLTIIDNAMSYTAGNGMTFLHYLVATQEEINRHDIIQHVVNNSKDINTQDSEGKTALHFAAAAKYYNALQLLLESHADPNARDNRDRLPITYACLNRHWASIHLLLKYMNNSYDSITKIFLGDPQECVINSEITDNAICFAAALGAIDSFRWYIKNSKILAVDSMGRNILHMMFMHNTYSELFVYVKKHSSLSELLSMPDVLGFTPLHYLALLTDRNPNVMAVERHIRRVYGVGNYDSFVHLRFSKSKVFMRYIERNPNEVLKSGAFGINLLEAAAIFGRVNILRYLLNNYSSLLHTVRPIYDDLIYPLRNAAFSENNNIVIYRMLRKCRC